MTKKYSEQITGGLYSDIKVDNPNQLAILVSSIEEHPFTTAELERVVSGVLSRHHVEPLLGNEWLENHLYLDAMVSCQVLEEAGGIMFYDMTARFKNFNASPPVTYPFWYGSHGTGFKEAIISSFKHNIENAMADFIKANFNS